MSNCRNSPVYCPISAVAAETVRDQERSVVFGRFRTSFGGQVVSDSRLPPSSGHLLRRDRGGGRSYCEGIPPAGGACAPRKGSYSRVPLYILYGKPSPCTYYSERRWGMCPKKKGRLGCLEGGRPISLNIANPPLKHGQQVAEGKSGTKTVTNQI